MESLQLQEGVYEHRDGRAPLGGSPTNSQKKRSRTEGVRQFQKGVIAQRESKGGMLSNIHTSTSSSLSSSSFSSSSSSSSSSSNSYTFSSSHSQLQRTLPSVAPMIAESTPIPMIKDVEPTLSTNYCQRFVGASNIATDIKETIFLGLKGEYIAAGSDDGRYFIWDRFTGEILLCRSADPDVLNSIVAHPLLPVFATAGLDDCIRIWGPPNLKHTFENSVKDDPFGPRCGKLQLPELSRVHSMPSGSTGVTGRLSVRVGSTGAGAGAINSDESKSEEQSESNSGI